LRVSPPHLDLSGFDVIIEMLAERFAINFGYSKYLRELNDRFESRGALPT